MPVGSLVRPDWENRHVAAATEIRAEVDPRSAGAPVSIRLQLVPHFHVGEEVAHPQVQHVAARVPCGHRFGVRLLALSIEQTEVDNGILEEEVHVGSERKRQGEIARGHDPRRLVSLQAAQLGVVTGRRHEDAAFSCHSKDFFGSPSTPHTVVWPRPFST